MTQFWEDLALNLLEHNLNGNSLNARMLKEMFKDRPELLEELDITNDGEKIKDIDEALYHGCPRVIEIREAKPNEVWSCKACERTFKRRDNFSRHLRSALHIRRQKAFELAQEELKATPKVES